MTSYCFRDDYFWIWKVIYKNVNMHSLKVETYQMSSTLQQARVMVSA